jgi:hypothetical protein
MDRRPGLDRRRLTDLMRAAIDRCQLDLSGLTVLTEAASGAYIVTPVIAAMAGATVRAVTRSTRYGSADEIRAATLDLAGDVANRIEIADARNLDFVRQADIVTNSGHVRPINAEMIAAMKPGAVLSLMYEAWEYRPDDLDLQACRDRQVLVAATNERHPNVDVFSFLGPMAVRLMHEAGVSAYRGSVLLLCDNPFRPFIESGLRAAGATVETVERVADARGGAFDAIVVSLTPGADVVLNAADARLIARRWPGAVVTQFWGDIDRAALAAEGVPVWRAEPPHAGHMGILLSDLGPEPIVRLQTGGLKAAEALWRQAAGQPNVDLAYVEVMCAPQGATCHAFC